MDLFREHCLFVIRDAHNIDADDEADDDNDDDRVISVRDEVEDNQKRQIDVVRSCVVGGANGRISLATFGIVSSADESSSSNVYSRLVLYCDDYRLLLLQFPKKCLPPPHRADQSPSKFYIPVDPEKGAIISMCLNRAATRLLALTSLGYLYWIPFNFELRNDPINDSPHYVLREDAQVIRCLSIRDARVVAAWQRPHSILRSSIAIIGNDRGRLAFVDLDQRTEFKQLTVSNCAIQSLTIFDELYSQTLLVTCANKLQYQLTLEFFKSILNASSQKAKSVGSLSASNFGRGSFNLLANCMLGPGYPGLGSAIVPNDEDDFGSMLGSTSITDADCTFTPQLLTTVCDDAPIGNQFLTSSSAPDTPPTTCFITTSNQTEFLDLLDDCVRFSFFPQPRTGTILAVKQHKPKYDFENSARKEPRNVGEIFCGGSSADSESSDTSLNTFCSVSLNTREISLDIHEFLLQEFNSKSIILATSKPFSLTFDMQINSQNSISRESIRADNSSQELLKIIDCGHRFFLLVYRRRMLLVSKYFTEQRNFYNPSSPKSPLLLKKSDSLRSKHGGSFRRKNYQTQHSNNSSSSSTIGSLGSAGTHVAPTGGTCSASGCVNTAIVEDFRIEQFSKKCFTKKSDKDDDVDDEITDAFLLSALPPLAFEPDFSILCNAHYPLASGQDLESIIQAEHAAIEAKLSPKINDLIKIDERFLVITTKRCFTICSHQESFAEYFHHEIVHMLDLVESAPGNYWCATSGDATCDGDVITRAKLLVDCFVYRSNKSAASVGFSASGSPAHPCQSWQFWLTRSALLLLQELARDTRLASSSTAASSDCREPELTAQNLAKFGKIFRLFELARTPKRRVITALTYFRFWSRALYYIRKFFETRILQELGDDERLYLAHQMLDCLLQRYTYCATHGAASDLRESEKDLYCFFKTYRMYYNLERTLEKLIDAHLYDMVRFVALAQADYLQLISVLLTKFQATNLEQQSKDTRTTILDLLTSKRLAYALLLSTRYFRAANDQFRSQSSPSLKLLQCYLDLVLKQLPQLSTAELYRLANILNPNRFEMQVLSGAVLDSLQGRSYLQEDGDSVHIAARAIHKRDLLNLYMFVLILCMRRTNRKRNRSETSGEIAPSDAAAPHQSAHKLIRFYDWQFLSNIKNNFANYSSLDAKMAEKEKDKIDADLRQTVPEEPTTDFILAAGTFFSFALQCHSNGAYIWGKFPFVPGGSANSSSTGKPAESSSFSTRHCRIPVFIDFFASLFSGVRISQVAAGHQHVLLRTEIGLFAFGSSNFGQLGFGERIFESKYPAMVKKFDFASSAAVIKIAVGSYHSCAITEDGKLWTWGWGLHGQLGHNSIDDVWTPKLVEALRHIRCVDVAAGYAHTVVLTDKGDLFVFGENTYSQLGVDMSSALDDESTNDSGMLDNESSKIKFSFPQKLTPNAKLPGTVKAIACGLFHTMALVSAPSSNGSDCERLFCWGLDPKTWRVKMRSDRATASQSLNLSKSSHSAQSGALSDASRKPTSVHEYARIREISLDKVPAQSRIKKIAAGQSHSLILTDDARCYSFGFGREGQLGLGSSKPSSSLMAEPILELEAIADIACGAAHSLAVNVDGVVWGWGQNSDYQLDNSQLILDQAGGDASSTRRNSLLSTLMRRGDDQLMSRLMSLQKSVEWIPIRVYVPISEKSNCAVQTKENHLLKQKANLFVPIGSKNKELVPRHLIECLVRHRDLLDLRAMLQRFNYFDYPQVSSIVCHFLGDSLGTYKSQLRALLQDARAEFAEHNAQKFTEHIASKYFNEIADISIHFMSTIPLGARSETQLFQMIETMIRSWITLNELLSTFAIESKRMLKQIITQLYLDSPNGQSAISNPYFGLHVLRLLKQELNSTSGLEFRKTHQIDDQFLLRLLQRTQSAIESAQAESIVSIQQFLQQDVGLEDFYKCSKNPNLEIGERFTFPFEQAWRNVLRQFGADLDEKSNLFRSDASRDTANAGDRVAMKPSIFANKSEDDLDSETDEIEVQLSCDSTDSDQDAEKENRIPACTAGAPLLFVFKCGHVFSQKQLINLFAAPSSSSTSISASSTTTTTANNNHAHELSYRESICQILREPLSSCELMRDKICLDCFRAILSSSSPSSS